MIPRTHADCVNLIRLTVSELGGLPLPYTVGMFQALESDRKVKVGLKGVSDTICCYRGQFVAIEAKLGKDPWRDDQRKFAASVERSGGRYILVRWDGQENGIETLKRELER